ncbi:MAG TPA: glycosyltransferase [Bacteriovoracaceae bacterium]|nr:glycosyltransferase [Bacteriovoracaceae bacterium]
MKLALYVHDFRLEVGHSNSLIELVRHLPASFLDNITELEVVSHTATDLKILFPNFKGHLRWTKVPFGKLQPFLLKSIAYQAWTFLHNRFFQTRDTVRIGIGICCLDVHAASIQFIHYQWTEKGLQMEQDHALRLFYKKFLFKYFEICEDIFFGNPKRKFFSPAGFLTQHLKRKYPHIDATTIYSGVNLSRFELNSGGKIELLNTLILKYPQLSTLDLMRPVYLFVGAYERKGLHEALDLVRKQPGAQFIVIGSPSFGRAIDWPQDLSIYTITFTREVSLFYDLADCFVFPTLYEPFGLVLFEAMAMGLTIITRKHEVGASELLAGLPEVYFSDQEGFEFPRISVKCHQDKKDLREKRLSHLGDVSWNKASLELAAYLSSVKTP